MLIGSLLHPDVVQQSRILKLLLNGFLVKNTRRLRKIRSQTPARRSNDTTWSKKKSDFFNAYLLAFSQGKTKKINEKIEALEKLFKLRLIPFFQLFQFRSSDSLIMPCYESVRPSIYNYSKPPKTAQNVKKTLWLHTDSPDLFARLDLFFINFQKFVFYFVRFSAM